MKMKIVSNIIGLCIAMCLCFACSLKEDAFIPQTNDGVFQFNAAVEDYSVHDVSTKAADTDINELTMLIFTAEGDIVGRPVNIPGSNPTFLVDTKQKYIWDPNATGDEQMIPITNGDANLHACDIYMVANSWGTLKDHTDIKTLNDLKAITIPVAGIDVPEGGFPMIGKQADDITFDLAENKLNGVSDGNTLATITMKKLYAMVNVRIQVIADQVVATPSFTFTDWQVCNIPAVVWLGEPATGEATPNTSYIAQSQKSTVLTAGDKLVEHTVSGSDYLEFSFYMPEHYLYAKDAGGNKITKDNWGKYPAGLAEDAYQRYKPLLCNKDQGPTYVKVHGSYKDHQGNAKEVTYDIYLGQNPVDDFCVKRNQLLNNTITIKGATDRRPDEYPDDYDPSNDNISIDHRVDIGSEGFIISMEREAVMDSHFEVRPMDFVVSDEARIVVTIDEDSNSDPAKNVWMRFEQSGNTPNHISGVGVRKYFTSDLITSLTAAENKTLTITEDTRLWLYFDENTNVYDSYLDTDEENPLPKWRDIKLKVDYYAPENKTSTPDKQMVYTFRQWHLWRIRDKDNTRYYDIEHEEEYLYNYASDDNYGKTTDGMVWGLDGITFSGNMGDDFKTKAITGRSGGGWASGAVNDIIENLPSYYDFYLPREAEEISADLVNTQNQFAGRRFSNGIIDSDPDGTGTYVSISQIKRELNDSPESAIEYCLNKNLRNSSGLVDNRKWYLPAIDEMEQIMVGGYSQFGVFQDKFYWSSQPAFHKNFFLYNTNWFASLLGGSDSDVWCDYYMENPQSARATSALLVGVDGNGDPDYDYAGSGVDPNTPNIMDSYYQSLVVSYDNTNVSPSVVPDAGKTLEYWDGEKSWGFPVTKNKQIYKVKYDTGYHSRSTNVNRVRCVYRSGLVTDL